MIDQVRAETGTAARRGWKLGYVVLEALLVGAIGAVLAFVANEISPRGLELRRDYFPNDRHGPTTSSTVTNGQIIGATNGMSLIDRLAARFHQEGLQLADSNMATKLFQDARYAQGLVVFIDARNDEHYQAGHIPGAYQLDHFRVQDYIATALPVCQTAEQIIVYCNGGDCDDSENTALFLRDAGIDKSKLFVYAGGMAEWMTNRMPVEIGPRNSGNVGNSK